MREVRVVYVVNETVKTEKFTCSDASATMAGEYGELGTYLGLTDGVDRDERTVLWKLYRNAEEITCFAVDTRS